MSILKDMSSLKEYQVEILGSKMVVDLDEMMGFIKLDNEQYNVEEENADGEFKPEFAINAAKYEMLRLFLDVILSTNEEIDEKMGYKSLDNLSFPFKLSFNTLIEYKIIKEVN